MRLVKVKLALVDADRLIATDYVSDASGQWERKLISLSSIQRNVTLDRTFERGGATLVMDDSDLSLKAMFADDTNRRIYGKPVTIYAYQPDGAALAETVTMTIRGWRRDGETVVFDLVQEFAGAAMAIPETSALVIDSTTFPDAAPRGIGQPVPMPTGVCYHHHGAIVAYKVVNREVGVTDRKYLLTWSDPAGDARITTIDSVFENDVRILPTSRYTLSRDASGWEFVEYNGTEQWVRVNVTAVSNPGTSGANPVVALRGILTDAGVTLVDDGDGGTDDFESYCDTASWAMGGTPEGGATLIDYLETWCQNFDCFWRVDSAGAVHIRHIDWSTVAAVASLTEQHFIGFAESASMDSYANRMRSRWSYGNASWSTETLTGIDGTADYPSTAFVQEADEEYLLGSFGVTNPCESKLRWLATTRQTVSGVVDLYQWESLCLGLLKVASVTHSEQIGAAGNYLIMSESVDYINGTVAVEMIRLWGVT
jgi:hypothetical protein